MKVNYLVEIIEPCTHIVKVRMSFEAANKSQFKVFLPSWSPGSYLMREYAKNVRSFKALADSGEYIHFEQLDKGTWSIDLEKSQLKNKTSKIEVEYEVYCHELTVRTSHIDYSHAFLHGPSYLMGVLDCEMKPEIEFRFPGLWSKLHTGLKDISDQRERFIYTADSYDDLIDSPVEIGCHESDGFMHDGKEHHLIWYGETYPHTQKLKADIKKIVETVASHFSSIPYEQYLFITHFKRGLYGGLEHKNSTALHFDGRKLNSRMDYVYWLALVAHEYFHTWNVKRIRPIELGPFDYRNENYTRMHWLTEGLTSFMDELLVLRSGLCTLEEYLELQKNNLLRFFSIPGKKFHSLEDSSFNAWIKLYRPDENSNNSSISYYLKGGLVFSILHFELVKQGKSINDLLDKLWQRYLDNKEVGVTTQEVLQMITDISSKELSEKFETLLKTTEDIDFESYYKEIGLEFVWDIPQNPSLDVTFEFKEDRVFIKTVELDGAAYKCGLNAGDEIIAVNNMRFLKEDIDTMKKYFKVGPVYNFVIARLGTIVKCDVAFEKSSRVLKEIKVLDRNKAMSSLI